MLGMQPRVVDAGWAAVAPLLPHPVDDHPLGCHRPRVSDRTCFEGILYRLVLEGCSWVSAARLVNTSATTLRRRRDEWVAAGCSTGFATRRWPATTALSGWTCVYRRQPAQGPCGGQGTGPNPTDRGKRGWEWSLATDRDGIPIGWATDGANRHNVRLFAPTLDR